MDFFYWCIVYWYCSRYLYLDLFCNNHESSFPSNSNSDHIICRRTLFFKVGSAEDLIDTISQKLFPAIIFWNYSPLYNLHREQSILSHPIFASPSTLNHDITDFIFPYSNKEQSGKKLLYINGPTGSSITQWSLSDLSHDYILYIPYGNLNSFFVSFLIQWLLSLEQRPGRGNYRCQFEWVPKQKFQFVVDEDATTKLSRTGCS